MLQLIRIGGAAKDFGWHDPGYIHTAIISNLQPSVNYSYKYGRYAFLFTI